MPSAVQYAIRAGGPVVLADVQSLAVMARKLGDGVGLPVRRRPPSELPSAGRAPWPMR